MSADKWTLTAIVLMLVASGLPGPARTDRRVSPLHQSQTHPMKEQ